MSEPHKAVGAIFDAALELPPERRAAYLQEACAGDEALRQRVEALLGAHDSAGAFMDSLAAPGRETEKVNPVEKPGDRIGRYKLLQQIGEGGCGVVYMAEQEEPIRRKVALKVIKLGMDTRQVIARFEAERQTLAAMDHPNIAKVLDAGATDTGRPYFVMELVRGVRITDFCDQQDLSTRERLALFTQVCGAIQHAHQKGIIHRDIKPSNILVTVNDGVAVPIVIDFGIAKATQGKLTDLTLFTAFEQFLGTPAYMSPEQAVMTNLDIDTRSDIYSLGVLLYELLTGKTPFDTNELLAAGLDEMRRTIREREPAQPSTRLSTMQAAEATSAAKHRQTDAPKLIHSLRGDLDWIVMKALEKDRARRYETANGLAMDVQRHLNDEPVVARQPSRLYLFRKLVRRNKLVVAAGVVITVSLILGLGAATVAAVRVHRDNQQIRKAKDEATEKLWAAYLAEARGTRTSGRAGQRFDSLEAVKNAAAIHANLAVRNEAIACLVVSDLRVFKQHTLKRRLPDFQLKFAFDLEKYALAGENGSITLRAVTDDRSLATLPAPGLSVESILGFSSNSKYLAARYWHDREGQSAAEESDWIWDVDQQKVVLRVANREATRPQLTSDSRSEFSPDSRLLASRHLDGAISIYDLASGKELRRELKCFPGTSQFQRLLLNPENTRLACFSEGDPRVDFLEVESVSSVLSLDCPALIDTAAWSADGKRFAAGCRDYRIYIWDVQNGQLQTTLEGHSWRIMNVAFNHAGNLLASTSWEGLTKLWNIDTGRQIAVHPGSGWAIGFTPDDRFLVGWSAGDELRDGLLEVADGREFRLLYVQRAKFGWSGPEFSADGRILAAGTDDVVSFWDTFSGKKIASFRVEGSQTHIFHPDGRSMILIDRAGGVRVRSLQRTGGAASFAFRLGKPRWFHVAPPEVPEIANRAALSVDGRRLAVTHESEGEAFIFDLQVPSAKPVVLRPHPLADYIAISPDGRWAATASWHNPLVKLWDARSGDLLRTLEMPNRTTVVFSPDGRWLATSTTEYQLWEVGSWQPKGPPVPGNAIAQWNLTAFSPDGRVMARTTETGSIQLQETSTGKPLATLEAPGGLEGIRFSPDGSHLAAMLGAHQVMLWDLRLIRKELAEMHLDWDLPPYPPVEPAATAGQVTLEVESDSASQGDLSAIPARDTNAASNLIDLSAYYNAGLTKPWHSGSLNNSLINLPGGLQTMAGVAFDLRGLIQLRGESRDESRFPEQVAGIRVERKARAIHFLHATQRSLPDGRHIGHYVVHYADGSESTLPIIYGQNVRDWWVHSGEPVGPNELSPAWSGYNEQSPAAGSIRLFKWTWKNPLPNLGIRSLDFVSEKTLCAPFLVAITVE